MSYKMYSKVIVNQILLHNSPRRFVDQNGNRYEELDRDFMAKHAFDGKYSIFQCIKNDSQGCMGKIALQDQSKTAKVIQFHSCRWSYEEASTFSYLRYGVNKYIRSGYHPPVQTWMERWNLLWSVHSETWNIWTHAVGIIISTYYLWNTVFYMDGPDYWMLVFHDLMDLNLYCGSTVYHWLHICSTRWCKRLSYLDHCGVANAAFVSHFVWMYYALRQEYFWFGFYFLILCLLVLSKLAISLKNIISRKFNFTLDGIRVHLLLGQHLLMLFITGHQLIVRKTCTMFPAECCNNLLLLLLCYWIGFIAYGVKLPESIWPGNFDTVCNGHQIMHVSIVIGSILKRYCFNCLRHI